MARSGTGSPSAWNRRGSRGWGAQGCGRVGSPFHAEARPLRFPLLVPKEKERRDMNGDRFCSPDSHREGPLSVYSWSGKSSEPGSHWRPAASARLLLGPLAFTAIPLSARGKVETSAAWSPVTSTHHLGPPETLQQDLPRTHPSYPAFLSAQVCRGFEERRERAAQASHRRAWAVGPSCVPRQSPAGGASSEAGHNLMRPQLFPPGASPCVN